MYDKAMKELIFATGNSLKFAIAQQALAKTDITLVRKELDIPEIQSADGRAIAIFSARWACEQLAVPVAVSDAGYYIEALNGFPGPFIKYINQWLSADDLLRLMEGKENRHALIKDCVAYCTPGRAPVCFEGVFRGTIALQAGRKGATPINEIFIPEGLTKPESEITGEERKRFWAQNDGWIKLGEYLIDSHL